MGAPVPKMEAAENASAEALLSSLETIAAKERRKHASVFNYWLSIRGDRPFPLIRDLDPLEISDAGPFSVLLEMAGGGENAEIRHLGQAIKGGVEVERISEAPTASLLSCIHAKLPIVAACRQAIAFEDQYTTDEGTRRCWVTLLPFSAAGSWIDFVYGFVSLDGEQSASEDSVVEAQESVNLESEPFTVPLRPFDDEPDPAEDVVTPVEQDPEVLEVTDGVQPIAEPVEQATEAFELADEVEPAAEAVEELPEALELVEEIGPVAEPVEELPEAPDEAFEPETVMEPVEQAPEALGQAIEAEQDIGEEPDCSPAPALEAEAEKPGFSAKILEGLATLGGFYGQGVQVAPSSFTPEYPEQREAAAPVEAGADEEPAQPTGNAEGTLQNKLEELRTKADEARQAKIRSNIALYEGLGAAYDFALDAELEPEEYLRLVEGQGLKIQLRSPMKPVVKLGFDGMCDEATIGQLEAVLAWALKMDLPRGSLAERIEAEGGIAPILNGQANA